MTVGGEALALTDTEYRLLACLYEHAGQVVTHQQILRQVWGAECRDSPQYVHAYVWRLRQKLEPAPHRPVYLETMHGVGYRFNRQPPAA